MTHNGAPHGSSGHHASAALHHQQAATHHQSASLHYRVGKDYAHAAHQALVAHGHALRALDHGDDAWLYYAEHHGATFPKNPERALRPVDQPADQSKIPIPALDAADHHSAAVQHHELSARHHGQAIKHAEAEEYEQAIHEAHLAHEHAQHALFHGHEAAMYHVEHYGKSGPTAEIA